MKKHSQLNYEWNEVDEWKHDMMSLLFQALVLKDIDELVERW